MMPKIWLMMSLSLLTFGDVEVAGAGAFVHSPAIIFDSNNWGCAQDLDDSAGG